MSVIWDLETLIWRSPCDVKTSTVHAQDCQQMVQSSSSSVELLGHIEVNPDQYLHCTITVKVSWHKHTLHPRRCCRRASDSSYSKLFHTFLQFPQNLWALQCRTRLSLTSTSFSVILPIASIDGQSEVAWILWLCAGILFWWTLVWCWIPPVSIIFAALFS